MWKVTFYCNKNISKKFEKKSILEGLDLVLRENHFKFSKVDKNLPRKA